MSLKAILFCACVAIIALASANPATSGKAEGCTFDGQFVPVGVSVPAKNICQEYTCLAGGGITGRDCGLVGIPPALRKKCHFAEDKDKPYPRCCPTIVCNE